MVTPTEDLADRKVSKAPIEVLRSEFRRLRNERGLTQDEVAQMLGECSQGCISNWERGKNKNLRRKTLQKVIELVDRWRREENIVDFQKSDSFAESGKGTFAQLLGHSAGEPKDVPVAAGDSLDILREVIIDILGDNEPTRKLLKKSSARDIARVFLALRCPDAGPHPQR